MFMTMSQFKQFLFTIDASTPEETKLRIVDWLREQASNHRRNAMIAKRKTIATREMNKAAAFVDAAAFISHMTIVSVTKN